jgi:hypothetical protein
MDRTLLCRSDLLDTIDVMTYLTQQIVERHLSQTMTVIDLGVSGKDGWQRQGRTMYHNRDQRCYVRDCGTVWNELVSHGPSAIVTLMCEHYHCDCGADALVVSEVRRGQTTAGGPYGPNSEKVIALLDKIMRLSLDDIVRAVEQWDRLPMDVLGDAWSHALTLAQLNERSEAMDATLRTIEDRVIQRFEHLQGERVNDSEGTYLCYSMIDVASAAAMAMVVEDLCDESGFGVLSTTWDAVAIGARVHS